MADMIDRVKAKCGDVLLPIMITCDPARDKPEVLRPYLKEFHPDIIGLTGEYEDIKQTCKEYRVYFSTPPELIPGQDYLVDHSIYFYLMGMFATSSTVDFGEYSLTTMQIPKATLLKPLGEISQQSKRQMLFLTTLETGKVF